MAMMEMPLDINNIGDGTLNYALNLVEVGPPRAPMVNPVPDGVYGKDEQRRPQSGQPHCRLRRSRCLRVQLG